MLAGEEAERCEERRRVAPGAAAERAGVHDSDRVGLEYRCLDLGGTLSSRIPSIRDVDGVDTQAPGKILGYGPRHADDGVGSGGNAAFHRGVEALLRLCRPRRTQRLIAPTVAEVDDPRRPMATE